MISFETAIVENPTSGPRVQWQASNVSITANYDHRGLQILVATPAEAVYTEVAQRIRELARLRRGWDGHDGLPAQQRPIEQALTFLIGLAANYLGLIPPPLAGPLPDGGVALVWRQERQEIEVLFLSDGTAEFAASDREGAQPTAYLDAVSLPDLLAIVPQHIAA